jgi:hypothetical protein
MEVSESNRLKQLEDEAALGRTDDGFATPREMLGKNF